MAYTPEQIQLAISRAEAAGDMAAAARMRLKYSVPMPAAPAPPSQQGGFIPALRVGAAGALAGLARPIEDLTGIDTGAQQYAERVQQANPLAYQEVGDFLEAPGTSIKEIIGGTLPSTAATIGGALVGARIPALRNAFGAKGAGFAGAALPAGTLQYGEIRERQDESGEGGPLAAIAGAIPATALDLGFGAERFIPGLRDAGERVLKEGANRAIEAGKSLLRTGAQEAITEPAQSTIGRIAAGQPIADEAALQEAATGALAGFVAGGAAGGIGRAMDKRAVPAQTPAEKAPAAATTPPSETEGDDFDTSSIDPNAGFAAPEEEGGEAAPAAAQAAPEVAPVEPAVAAKPDFVAKPDGNPFRTVEEATAYRRNAKLFGYAIWPADGGGFGLASPKFVSDSKRQVPGAGVISEPLPSTSQPLPAEDLELRAPDFSPGPKTAVSEAELNAALIPDLPDAGLNSPFIPERQEIDGYFMVSDSAPVKPMLALPAPKKAQALPSPARTASGAIAPAAREGQIPKEPELIFGRATPNGRVDFMTPSAARAYRREIGAGPEDYDIVRLPNGKYALRQYVFVPTTEGIEVLSEVAPSEGRRENVVIEDLPTTEGLEVGTAPSSTVADIPEVRTPIAEAPKGAGKMRVGELPSEEIVMQGGEVERPPIAALPAPKMVPAYTGPDGQPVMVSETDIANAPKPKPAGIRERVAPQPEMQARIAKQQAQQREKDRVATLAAVAKRAVRTREQADRAAKAKAGKYTKVIPHPNGGGFVNVTPEEQAKLEPPSADEIQGAGSGLLREERLQVGLPGISGENQVSQEVAGTRQAQIAAQLQRPSFRQRLESLGQGAGYVKGGQMMPGPESLNEFGPDDRPKTFDRLSRQGVVGRTRRTANERRFARVDREAPLEKNDDGSATRRVIAKALSGQKLGAAEQRHYDALAAVVDEEIATDMQPLDQALSPESLNQPEESTPSSPSLAEAVDKAERELGGQEIARINAESDSDEDYERNLRAALEAKRGTARAVRQDNLDPTAEESARVEAGIRGKSPIQAAEWIAQNGTPAERLIATKVADRLKQLESLGVRQELHIVANGDRAPSGMTNARGASYHSNFASDPFVQVWINDASMTGKVGTSTEIVLHELVHAATMGAVTVGQRAQARQTALGQAVKELFQVHAAIRRHFDARKASGAELTPFEQAVIDRSFNAIESENETITWALTNKEMQDYLDAIPYKGRSLWSWFVQSLRNFLGLPSSSDSVLSEILRVSEVILTEDLAPFAALAQSSGMGLSIQSPRGVQVMDRPAGPGRASTTLQNLPQESKPLQSRTAGEGATVAAIRKAAADAVGEAGVASLERQGILKIVTAAELPDALRAQIAPKTDGLFDPDTATAYILADRADPVRVKALLLHEIGEHYGLPGMLGASQYNFALNEVRRLVKGSDDARFAEAVEHVRKNYSLDESSNIFAREVLARYAENPGTATWWRTLVGRVREFLRSLGFAQELSEADLAYLVNKSLKRAARGQIRFLSPDGDKTALTANPNVTETHAFRAWFGDSKVVDAVLRTFNDATDYKTRAARKRGYDGDDPWVKAKSLDDIAADKDVHPAALRDALDEVLKHFGIETVTSDSGSSSSSYLEIRGPENEDGDRAYAKIRFSDHSKESRFTEASAIQFIAGDGTGINDIVSESIAAFNKAAEDEGLPTIKSAIGNSGAFDPSNPSILKSQGAAPTLTPDGTGFFSRDVLVRRFQNQMNRWDKLAAYLAPKGGDVARLAQDIVDKAVLYYGKVQANYRDVTEQYINRLKRAMEKPNISFAELNKFLIAKHAKERNEAVARINPDKPDGGAGMLDATTPATTANAQAYLQGLTPQRRQELEAAASVVYDMNRWRLKKQLDEQLLSQDEYDLLTKKYQFYVPLKGRKEDEDDAGDALGTAGFAVRGAEYRRALGRASEAADPIAVSIMDTERTILRGNKSIVARAVYALAKNPDAQSIMRVFTAETAPADMREQRIYKVPVKNADGKIKTEYVKDKDGNRVLGKDGKPKTRVVTKEEVRIGIKAGYASAGNVFPVKIDGKTQYVQIKDEELAAQLRRLGEAELGPVMDFMSTATSLFGRTLTQWNPSFVPINFARDLIASTINSMAIPGVNAGKVFAEAWSSVPTIWNWNFGERNLPLSADYREFLDEGATIGGLGLSDIQQIRSQFARAGVLAEPNQKITAQRALGKVEQVFEKVSMANEIFENSVRFSVYRNARDAYYAENLRNGMPDSEAKAAAKQKAAVMARQISTDFNQRGELSRTMGAFFVFFNAAVQGLASFNKFARNPKVIAALASLAAMGFAARVWNGIMGGDDEETLEDNAEYVRAMAKNSLPLIFGETVTALPVPYIFNIFSTLGYSAADMLMGGEVGKNVGQIAKTVLGALSPLGEPKETNEPVTFLAKTFTPTIIAPFVDLLTNENFFGGPIARKPSIWDDAPPPNAYLYWNSASDAGKKVAEFLNWASGGGGKTGEPGFINISPDQIDYLTGYYFGGAGRAVMQTTGIVMEGFDRFVMGKEPLKSDEISLSQIPVIGRIVREVKPEWYDNVKYRELESDAAYIEKRIKAREPVEGRERFIYNEVERADKFIKSQFKQLKNARERKDDMAVDRIETLIEDRRQQVLRAINIRDGKIAEAAAFSTAEEMARAAQLAGNPAFTAVLLERSAQ